MTPTQFKTGATQHRNRHGEELNYSEHVVRVLVLGLAVAYTYLLLS